jgi:hypothetical protein
MAKRKRAQVSPPDNSRRGVCLCPSCRARRPWPAYYVAAGWIPSPEYLDYPDAVGIAYECWLERDADDDRQDPLEELRPARVPTAGRISRAEALAAGLHVRRRSWRADNRGVLRGHCANEDCGRPIRPGAIWCPDCAKAIELLERENGQN